MVDPAFGTGVVQVTPAHDPNDFEAGRRHGLASVTVIGFDAKMTEAAGPGYSGLDRFAARRRILDELAGAGLLRGEKAHTSAVGRCQRCDTVVEPLVSLQWWIRIAPLAERAVEATDRFDTRFVPESWKKTYDEWMRNIRDWCISRQLWWGHEIPAWYCPDGHVTVPEPEGPDPGRCGTCGSGALTRDPDVFDTWFSSWLMPLSALGWPEETADFKRFYPTTVLVTAFDIIFFWVARMIMAGCWFAGRAPFADVFIHGLVRDERGQKMSKTKGNVIDPLEACDEFGADAVRFALAQQSGTGRDIPFGTSRIAPARAFATKVWNAARFALGMLEQGEVAEAVDFGTLGTVDRWILSRLSATAGRVNASLESFRFDEAAGSLYGFFWSEFCDGYVEMAKAILRDPAVPEPERAKTRWVLRRVLLDSLGLLHPFMPFVSCEIREALSGDGLGLAREAFPVPNPDWSDPRAVETVETIRAAATRIRNLRAERGLPQTEPLAAGLEVRPGPLADSLAGHRPLLMYLARLSSLEVAEKVSLPDAFHDAVSGVGLLVRLPARQAGADAGARLARELEEIGRDVASLQAKLRDGAFLSKAPGPVVERARRQLAELLERRRRLGGNVE